MSSHLTKAKRALFPAKEKKAPEKKEIKLKANERPFTTGDFLMDSDGRIVKVGKCTQKSFQTLREDDEGNWTDHYGTVEWSELTSSSYRRDYLKLERSLEEYKAEAIHHLATGFKDLKEDRQMSDSTDLVATADKTYARTLRDGLTAKQQHVQIIQRTLERMKSEMDLILSNLREKIRAVSRVVDVIEIYLGVHEKIVQIQEGDPAPMDEPLTFRQLVLHMDEETAEDMDWQEVETFDQFFRDHTDQIFPEKKGVVVCRPRAIDKDYNKDPLTNTFMNEGNKDTYILIRNGDNLYRIWTSVRIYPNLFPGQAEMKTLLENTDKWGYDKEKAEDSLYQYKRNVLLLQGLIDRTEVFRPIPLGLNLLKADTYGDHVRFIYDGSNLLPSGRLDWHEYREHINAQTERGDRLYVAATPYGEMDESSRWRSPLHDKGWRDKNGPPTPPAGVYNVKEINDRVRPHVVDAKTGKRIVEKIFLINYKPKSEERYDPRRGYVKRKNSIPFYLHQEDSWIINYERIKVEDIDFYLNDRVNRRSYLRMMPVLRGLKVSLLEEQEWEKAFVRFVQGRIKDAPQDLIWQTIEWWKRKVIEKRPLRKEDAKAVRMIVGKIKNELKLSAGHKE